MALSMSLSLVTYAETSPAGRESISFDDPAGDVYSEESNPNPADIVKLELSSDGEFVIIAATLAKAPTPLDEWPQATIAAAGFDTDLDETNGSNYFAGSPRGMEFSTQFIASIEPNGKPSRSAACSVIDFSASGDDAYAVKIDAAPRTPASGLTYTGKIAYESIGVRPGQTIRMSVKEAHDYGEGSGFFPSVLLTLK